MSKNISIAEGGTSRQFTNDKLKINLVGGGTEYYVPESSVQLGTKSVTANGTYTAASDGKYGFSQFSVNVRGAAGSADSSGKPTTSGGTAPGGVGSAVVGTDPETGNDVAVGVDEDGNLVQTPVPSGIEIVTLPTKTSYTAGETMDYSGLVVKMVNRDGTTFTDANHPNGHLSLLELVFPVTVAPAGDNEDTSASYSGSLQYPDNNPIIIQTGLNGRYEWPSPSIVRGYVYSISGTDVFGVCVKNQSVYHQFLFSRNQFYTGGAWGTLSSMETPEATEGARLISDPVVGNYYYETISGGGGEKPPFTLNEFGLNYSTHDFALQIFGGTINSGSTAIIPVNWQSSYTGDTYEDSFNISVTANNSSGGSGGGGTF